MKLAKPLNKYMDHSLLKPTATHEDFESFLDDAVKYQFAAVCVSPYMAAPVKAAIHDEDIKVCVVSSFPHGTLPLGLKLNEVRYYADKGIDEIDFVFNYGDLKSGRFDAVGKELESIGRLCKAQGIVSKCIVETCVLTEEEKIFVFRVLNDYTDIDYIKTSTGFGEAGANLGDILNWNAWRHQDAAADTAPKMELIQLSPIDSTKVRQEPLKIKAAGGIKDLGTALKFIAAGADRLGTSSSVKIMEEYNERVSAFAEGEKTPREL